MDRGEQTLSAPRSPENNTQQRKKQLIITEILRVADCGGHCVVVVLLLTEQQNRTNEENRIAHSLRVCVFYFQSSSKHTTKTKHGQVRLANFGLV